MSKIEDGDVIERQKKRPPKVDKKPKLETPRQWHVVLYNNSGEETWCVTCALTRTFNMSTHKALGHVKEAEVTGKSSVFIHSADVVKTKNQEANDALKGRLCERPSKAIFFKAEPI